MNNQNKKGNRNAQQIRQKKISQRARIPERPKENLRLIIIILLLFILFAGGVWFAFNIRTPSNQQLMIPNQADKMEVIGVIRTSGLSEEEKQKFELKSVEYQITDFGDYQKAPPKDQVIGYYLLSDIVNDELLGKCVRVVGIVPQEWKNKNKSDPYFHLVLNITNIDRVENSTCNPYPQTPPVADNTQEKLLLQGTVVHGKRPAPDIGYDYQLILSEPFIDKSSSTGFPRKVSSVDITPSTNSIWNELEDNINKEITVEGYMVWGYAESRYLNVTNVERSSVTEAVK